MQDNCYLLPLAVAEPQGAAAVGCGSLTSLSVCDMRFQSGKTAWFYYRVLKSRALCLTGCCFSDAFQLFFKVLLGNLWCLKKKKTPHKNK